MNEFIKKARIFIPSFHNEISSCDAIIWATNENWLLRSCECLHKKSNQSDRFPSRRESSLIGQSDCFPPRGENDPIGWESCFVFKTVVPKHRFCKLQNVWNVCEFGSDYKISPNPNWPHPKLDRPQIGPIPNWFQLQIGPRPKLNPILNSLQV